VFDERGAGNGLLLPAGLLREPLPRQAPPRSLVLYNAVCPSTPLPGWLVQRRLQGVVSLGDWWKGVSATEAALHVLHDQPLTAAAGLAHPERFFGMLRAQGLTITALALPDHHHYNTLPWAPDTTHVVVTEKDAIKLDPQRTDLGATQVWVAPLDFTFDPIFEAALIALIDPPTNS
jgi:tetraacyldisaccharide 4'-kinase